MTPNEYTEALQLLVGMPAETFVLHRKPMLFLDRLTAIGADFAECEWRVADDFPLVVPGLGVPSYAGIEYMAQCVAVHSGARARVRGVPPPLGLLLGTRNYECSIPYFEVGQSYTSRCHELVRDSQGMGSFSCRLASNRAIIAEANLAVFETPDEQPLNE